VVEGQVVDVAERRLVGPVVEEDAVLVCRSLDGLLRDAAAHAGVEDEEGRAGDGRDWVELKAADAADDLGDGFPRFRRDRKALRMER
jgi:hypothetical protein